MKIWGDYHTHTIYSKKKWSPYHHAKGTLEENVKAAKEAGLKEIAITDHGFNHMLYSVYRKDLEMLKKECKRLSSKYKINVILGVESNLISTNGDIDIKDEDYKYLDIVLCGFHACVRSTSIKEKLKFFYLNAFKSFFRSKKNTQRNTEAYIKAIEKHKIDVITHLKQTIPVNPVKVAEAAAKKGTLIELNYKHYLFTDEEMGLMVKTGVKFIINSDSHKPNHIGKLDKFIEKLEYLKIPKNQIANYEKLPDFLNYKRN